MRIRQSLKPGQKGTKRLLARYGRRLVRVRHRYDPARRRRLTRRGHRRRTAWQPRGARRRDARLVALRVAWGEVELGRRVKTAGGTWDRHHQIWRIPYTKAVHLGLLDRIVDG